MRLGRTSTASAYSSSDKPAYGAHGLALLNEIRTWGVVLRRALLQKILYFTIHLMDGKNACLIYTIVSIIGGYQGTLAGMWRIRSSCIWVSQKYPCATICRFKNRLNAGCVNVLP